MVEVAFSTLNGDPTDGLIPEGADKDQKSRLWRF